ncbi:MAG: heliorhodopsin HeR [Candidatus Saccharimonadales bacterium]|nr:heliorhodopsin HeR [Candidatus Saccharimonadales bacterium]
MKLKKLNRFNLIMGSFHAVQGLVVWLISNDSSREITLGYLGFNEATETLEPASRTLFDVQLGPLVAAFFFLSAIAHFYVATVGRKTYEANLKKGINKARWYEYSLSASLMIVLIAMLSGIFDAGTLLALFGLTAVMNLMGLVMEVHNQTTERTSWLSYNAGVLAGIIPWLVIAMVLWAGETAGDGDIPAFVYGIFVSLFLFFNTFAINMVLQYKKIGKWADYLYGERAYIILSLVAKSVLAWQIYGGTLQPV